MVPLSILDLRGLGRDAWAGGATSVVGRERDSWD